MTIELIGSTWCVINGLGLIVETFDSRQAAEQYLELEPA